MPDQPTPNNDAVTHLVPRAVRPLDIEHDQLMERAKAEHQARVVADQARKDAARAAVLADVERAIRSATGNCGYKADDGCDFCNGVDAALEQVRRMADETPAAETPVIPVQHAPGKAIRCPDCRAKGYTVCRDEPAAGAWQDGAHR